ncbi:hypothetical protein EDC04DRAFT_589126 [Pisolithus marmoratus]|nr:hypothetical protein EDC04DRAFT_589126 [Pisolithus marmoratus]
MRVRPPPSISYPVAAELASLPSSSLASPPTTPPRGHKHSLSKPMSWLNRSASSTSSLPHPRHPAPKPVRISEPKFDNSLEIFNIKRGSPLGSGAMVVRTPQEALCGSQVSQLFGSLQEEEDEQQQNIGSVDEIESGTLPPPPGSPPLPPLPAEEDPPAPNGSNLSTNSALSLPLQQLPLPYPSRPPPPIPNATTTARHPSLEHSRESTDIIPPVPSIPENIPPIPPQPPFEAILLSAVPDGAVDPANIIVALETCTTTFRTTLRTLTSRPSHLSKYIVSLLSHESETASVYSHASEASAIQHDNAFSAAFHDHLTSAGFLSQTSSNLHIFLDRPSAPYAHILSYLRSLPSSPEVPEVLPRAVHLGSASRAHLEALLELRDEASYLGLDELYGLCMHEINQRHSIFDHSRSASSCAMSIRSLHTVVEQNSSMQDSRSSQMSNGTSKSGILSSVPHHLGLRGRSTGGTRSESGVTSKSPPPGWI